VFVGQPKPETGSDKVRIISYGGRLAEWKGFREMAAAVRIARMRLPQTNIRWQVYGTSVLRPDNPIAPYEELGFLKQSELAAAYRNADILLSASWYESFPLFPLEAMACGLPVITTQYGTEEYAVHGVTAEVVQPRNEQSIADGLIRLIRNRSYRSEIAMRGHKASKKFTWDASVSRLEQILLGPGKY
jgi:glycosyltransferase involved in cell wall biosynthesis